VNTGHSVYQKNQVEFAEEIKSHHLKFLNCTAE
jgi:hypothetical protein